MRLTDKMRETIAQEARAKLLAEQAAAPSPEQALEWLAQIDEKLAAQDTKLEADFRRWRAERGETDDSEMQSDQYDWNTKGGSGEQ